MVWKSQIGPQTAELAQFGEIQKFDNFRRSKSEENLFLNFFKITEVWFIPPIPIRHYFWVFMQKISSLGLTQLRLSLMCHRTSAKCFQPKWPNPCNGLTKKCWAKKKFSKFNQNQVRTLKGNTTDLFSIKNCHPKVNSDLGGRTVAGWKIQDFGKFRVRKSYFQSFPDFFQNNWTEQTRMDTSSTW